jgi:hypothetical protein
MFRKAKQAPRCGGGYGVRTRAATTAGIFLAALVALTLYALIGESGTEHVILTASQGMSDSNSNTQVISKSVVKPDILKSSPGISDGNSNTQVQQTQITSKPEIIVKPVIKPVVKPVSVFFVGNSILQVNTTPRFLQYLRNAAQGGETHQPLAFTWTAFLRGGQTLATLVKQGMKFGHLQNLDYVIMNDQTQTPARPHLRRVVTASMIQDYAPMFQQSGATPVFVVTAAYREQVMRSADLGTVEQFTNKLVEGYTAYAAELEQRLPANSKQKPILAPVGLAYYQVHQERPVLWEKLFAVDSYHPSAYGTFLQCCVLYRSIFGELPPKHVAVPETDQMVEQLWVRLMNPQDLSPPTVAEAEYLWDVAGRVVDGLEQQK